jgi:hypothetical protein
MMTTDERLSLEGLSDEQRDLVTHLIDARSYSTTT